MDEAESKSAEVIARNIDLLENAVDFALTKMDDALFEAVQEVMNRKKIELRWEGAFGSNFEDAQWVAPSEWRAQDEEVDGSYHLSCYLGLEGDATTNVAYFIGGNERFAYIGIGSDTLKKKRMYKALAITLADDLKLLVERGFMFDEKAFEFKIPIRVGCDAMAKGFADEDLTAALAPIGAAIDLISQNLDVFKRIKEAVQRETEGLSP